MKESRKTLASRAYNAFGMVLKRCEGWAVSSVEAPLGYPAAAVARRLAQRLTERALSDFVEQAARRPAGLPSDEPTLRLRGLVIDSADGRISIEPKAAVACSLDFLLHWGYALAAYLGGVAGGSEQGPAALVYGLWPRALTQGGSDAVFLRFCAQGPVTPLSQAPRLAIQTSAQLRSTQPERVFYARQPLFELHRAGAGRDWPETARFLKDHFQALGAAARWALRSPAALLIARDLAYHAAVASLNRRGLIASIVTTYAEYHQQFLWMTDLPGRRFQCHMFWYSTNTRHLVYKDEPVPSTMPNNRLIRADVLWVWSEGYKHFLEELGQSAMIHVTGPLLCYLPEPPEPRPRDRLRVAIFDVTPLDAGWAERNGFADTYYNATTALAFIEDALESCRKLSESAGKPVEPVLKPKRGYGRHHDQGYLKRISELAASGRLLVASTESDLFSFIAGCEAVIVAPFSSPAYVAGFLGVPAIFYDATGQLLPDFEPAPRLAFAAGRAGLERSLREAAAQRKAEHAT